MYVLYVESVIVISIHTPARGVTQSDSTHVGYVVISIHTPARGVTLIMLVNPSDYYNFNPHSREGSDAAGKQLFHKYLISIHTPARGVTSDGSSYEYYWGISIHTPARGVTGSTEQSGRL